MMKQGWIDPSASVSMECGCGGTMRACLLPSRIVESFCFFSIQVSMSESFSRLARVISSSSRKLPCIVSLMLPSNLPKSRK
jgi:hypothetical protein